MFQNFQGQLSLNKNFGGCFSIKFQYKKRILENEYQWRDNLCFNYCFLYKYRSLEVGQLPRKHLPFLENLLSFIITKYLKQEVDDDLGVCVDELCGSFRRASPFAEHLPNKKIYYKITKEKDQMTFSHMFFCCCCFTGVRLQHFKYVRKNKKILNFVNKKKIPPQLLRSVKTQNANKQHVSRPY